MLDLNIDKMLLIVVGAHLKAEAGDRPLGYELQKSIQRILRREAGDGDWPVSPFLCTDVWYLNNEELHKRPMISIGGPGINAVSAYLYQRLPTALAIEDKLVIQLDVEMHDLRCAAWGMDLRHTAGAIELLEKKYLEDFVKAAMRQ